MEWKKQLSKTNILLPRVIYGNRGDILSRWALINALVSREESCVHVFAHKQQDIPLQENVIHYPYGKLHNVFPTKQARKALRNSERIFWSCGLDMTDESSLAKLLYLLMTFSFYRMRGKKIDCVFQGVGPLKTRIGRIMARKVLQRVSCFIARDPYTYELVKTINPSTKVVLAGDAIFLPGFEEQIAAREPSEVVRHYLGDEKRLLIGVNMRRWFHFSSDLIPFQLAKKRYEERGQEEMQRLVLNYVEMIKKLREKYNARIMFISAYNPGVFSWEDDFPWLQKVKSYFQDDEDVFLLEGDLEMLDYLSIMQNLDMVISMRLHSSLTTLRFGNPAVNLSYSLKGVNIFKGLGIEENAVDIHKFLDEPSAVWDRIVYVLDNLDSERKRTKEGVEKVMKGNMDALQSLFG